MTASITPQDRAAVPWWRDVNIGTVERVGRVLIGLAVVIAGTALPASAHSALAVVLVATGVVGVGFVFAAVACTAMMAMMMGGMGGMGGSSNGGRHE